MDTYRGLGPPRWLCKVLGPGPAGLAGPLLALLWVTWTELGIVPVAGYAKPTHGQKSSVSGPGSLGSEGQEGWAGGPLKRMMSLRYLPTLMWGGLRLPNMDGGEEESQSALGCSGSALLWLALPLDLWLSRCLMWC